MENPEEILHSLEEFSKMKPKDIPRELEEYLCFVAKTGDPVYQWSAIKSLFREKMVNVITEFYETCPSVEIPPCPNVDMFNYDTMKNFILEKLDTFAAAPFTVQRICELLTSPRKEYNRIDKYMRALEKNVLVVSTIEPGVRRNTAENGDNNIMNGLVSEHLEANNSDNVHMDINVDMDVDEAPWVSENFNENTTTTDTPAPQIQAQSIVQDLQETLVTDSKMSEAACSSTQDTVITCRVAVEEVQQPAEPYVSIEPVPSKTCKSESVDESDISVTITAIPAGVQKRRNSVEPVVSSETAESIPSTTVSTFSGFQQVEGNFESIVSKQTHSEQATDDSKPTTSEDLETPSSLKEETCSSIEEISADSSSGEHENKDESLDPQPDPEPSEPGPGLEAEAQPEPELDLNLKEAETGEEIKEFGGVQESDTLPPIETIKCSNIKFEEISIEAEISSSASKEEAESSEQVELPQIDAEEKETSNEAKPVQVEEEEPQVTAQLEEQNVVEKETEQQSEENEQVPADVSVEVAKSDEEVIVKAEATSHSSDLPL